MTAIGTTDVTVAAVRCLVRQAGGQSDEAVVFVHGNPGSSADFADLLPPVAEFARVVAPDMPGYGKSDRPRDFDYTIDGYVHHLDALLGELSVRRVHLVLHDFGGAWGLGWAAAHPDRVRSVTLFNVGVLPGYRWHKFARLWRTPIVGEIFQATTTRASFKLLAGRDNPKPFPDAFLNQMFETIDWPMKRAVLRLYRATDDLGAKTVAVGEALKAHSLPALVIWGDGDKYLPVRYADVQKSYFDAEVHVLPNVGHWPMIDEPDRVRELVIPFLRRQVERTRQAGAATP